jgi:hypothetical protein
VADDLWLPFELLALQSLQLPGEEVIAVPPPADPPARTPGHTASAEAVVPLGWTFLSHKVNEHLASPVLCRLIPGPGQAHPGLRLVPANLLDAIWMQFAQAVATGEKYSPCKECGRWFKVSPETARTSRLYCSNSCRTKVYRERQKRAQEMHREGKSVAEIAQELNTYTKTIKRWVSSRKE